MGGAIVSMGNEFIRGVGGQDWLVFGEDVLIGIVSGGYGEYAVMRSGVLFHLVCENENIDNKLWEGFDLYIPQFGKGHACIGVGGRPISGVKVK